MIERHAGDGHATTLRRGILGLAGLGIAGTTVELVFLRHWSSATQLIAWPAIIALAIGLWLVVRSPSPDRIRAARRLAVAVFVIAAVGIALHVTENLGAGPLDKDYAATWESLSPISQWWLAITGGVGPAPVLAPGVLAEIALAIGLGTLGHPVLSGVRPPADP